MPVTEPFLVTREDDDPWVTLAGGQMTGGGVSSGEARIGARWGVTRKGPPLRVHHDG